MSIWFQNGLGHKRDVAPPCSAKSYYFPAERVNPVTPQIGLILSVHYCSEEADGSPYATITLSCVTAPGSCMNEAKIMLSQALQARLYQHAGTSKHLITFKDFFCSATPVLTFHLADTANVAHLELIEPSGVAQICSVPISQPWWNAESKTAQEMLNSELSFMSTGSTRSLLEWIISSSVMVSCDSNLQPWQNISGVKLFTVPMQEVGIWFYIK